MGGLRREATIVAGDDALTTNHVCVLRQSLCDKLRMLHKCRRMGYEAWNKDLAVGQLHILEGLPFVVMGRVAHLIGDTLRVALPIRGTGLLPHRKYSTNRLRARICASATRGDT